jgi:multiple sugar transport system permease protein
MIKKINKPIWFLAPYVILFVVFIIIPVLIAMGLSFTYFNTIETPDLCNLFYQIQLNSHSL